MSQPTNLQPPPESSRPSTPNSTRKRKHRPWMPEKNARRRMKQVAELACQMLELALPIAAGAASDAGVPGLSSGLEALLELLRKIQAMKTNVEGVETLATRITALKDVLEKSLQYHQQLPSDMQKRINALCQFWEQIAADAQRIKCRGMIKRFFTSNVDATKLRDLVQMVNESIQDFMIQAMLNIEANLHAVRQDVKAIRTQQEMTLLSTFAKNARYNSSSVRRECLEGTRTGVLEDAYTWIHESSKEVATSTAEEKSGHFLWINGWAGTGKTTIACSIAKKYDKEGTLGANFFCSRSDAECRDPKLIFVTIAHQLCQYHEPFKDKVIAILRKNPDIETSSPLDQFKGLILEPLRELGGVFPTCVIIIDALDECQNEGLKSVILDILARHIRELAPFLFVVTSRPELHITTLFERANEVSLKDSTKPLILHNVHLESVLDDIRHYLADGFREIRGAFSIEDEWPSTQDMDRLTELSRGLFIFATTVLRFIGGADPKDHLQALLTASVSLMHDLYLEVLTLAYKNLVGTLHKTNPSLLRVLGAITTAEEPLSAPALANLLEMREGDVRNTLAKLRSVLHIPEEGSEEAIRFIHPTFPEFLLDASVAKPEAFCIVPAGHHLTLFTQSIVAMDSLRRNIADIRKPAAFRSELPGLSGIVKKCIPAHVAYASRFWSVHMSRCASGTLERDSRDLLNRFMTRQMLYWIEACSLLRILDGALTALKKVERICLNLGGPFSTLVVLLEDYHRFLWTYYYCIDTAPLQVYHSALGLAPTESLVRTTYTHELASSLVMRRGALSNWPPRRDAFTGHDGEPVCAIAFSPSGDCFATGGRDHKMKMWKTLTRTIVQSFDGHTGYVNCVAVSPDGVHAASGAGDQDVRVWQVTSGECVHILKGHTSWVRSVAYSADGGLLLSGTHGGEVKLWDMSDGRCILTLEETGYETFQAGLSPDGGAIARVCGAFLSLYDISTATEEKLDFPDVVMACTFSPDGRYVAARLDNVIRIWQCTDRSLVRSIVVSGGLTGRLAFSRDGTRLACGSGNGTVALWQVMSEDPPFVVKGHTRRVQDVSWSPDGLQVASASHDGTIHVCDSTQSSAHTEPGESISSQPRPAPSGPPRFALASHNSRIVLIHLPTANVDVTHFTTAPSMPEGAPTLTFFTNMVDAWDAVSQGDLFRITRPRPWAVITSQRYVGFCDIMIPIIRLSPDASLLAYRSPTNPQVVDVCNRYTGQVAVSLTGHTNQIFSATFSPDSALIATGSDDRSAKVWNAATGNIVHSYEGHTNTVRALMFSSDGRLVASGSDDGSVHVFEAETGRVERVFNGHQFLVAEMVFALGDKHLIVLDLVDSAFIWDMETGACTYEISVVDASWAWSLTVSPDDTSIMVQGVDLEPHPLPICDPGSRTWPAYAVSTDGWVYARSLGRAARLCWLPPEWRNLISWDGGIICCSDAERRNVVAFDVSRIPEYVENWGSISTLAEGHST